MFRAQKFRSYKLFTYNLIKDILPKIVEYRFLMITGETAVGRFNKQFMGKNTKSFLFAESVKQCKKQR